MAIWHVAPLRFAPAFRALGVCEHIWLRYKNFDPSCFDPIQKFGIVDLRTNSDFRSRSFDLFPPTRMECGRISSYLLYGSVASPSSNIEAWPNGTSLRSRIQGTRVMWTYLTTLWKYRSELFRSHSKIWYVDLRTNSNFRSRSFGFKSFCLMPYCLKIDHVRIA